MVKKKQFQNSKPRQPKSAFNLLKPDRVVESVKDLSGFELSMCLKRGIRERWFGPNPKEIPIEKMTSNGRNNKAKILRTLKFVKDKVIIRKSEAEKILLLHLGKQVLELLQ